jgi:hypothetical protein
VTIGGWEKKFVDRLWDLLLDFKIPLDLLMNLQLDKDSPRFFDSFHHDFTTSESKPNVRIN